MTDARRDSDRIFEMQEVAHVWNDLERTSFKAVRILVGWRNDAAIVRAVKLEQWCGDSIAAKKALRSIVVERRRPAFREASVQHFAAPLVEREAR